MSRNSLTKFVSARAGLRTAVSATLLLTGGCADEGSEADGADASTLPATAGDAADEGNGDDDDDGVPGTGNGTPGTTTGATPGTTDDGPGPDPGSPVVFDFAAIPDAPEFETGCRKVDFLFVVDNSGSMQAQQAQLLASFPGFITAIQASLEDTVDSYHVGVVSSDNYSGNAPGCTSIGNLVTQTAGFASSNMNCAPFAQGDRFATELDDLQTKFPCMAQVGASGSPIEQPVTATVAALSQAAGAPGACNDNFLRDDAILVVVIVTDDPPYDFDMDDAHPGTDTSGWYDAVIAAKSGDPEAVVMLGFVPWDDLSCVGGMQSPNLIGFVESFGDQGVLASICEPDYGPIFAATVETIVTTCENFDPPA